VGAAIATILANSGLENWSITQISHTFHWSD
jgi:hypothetical protein